MALVLAAGLALPGCDDPSPIFGGGFPPPGGGGDPGSLGAVAFPPDDGAWIRSAAPSLETMLPSGGGHATTTPVVLRFSESIADDGLDGAFELLADGGFAPTPLGVHLVGDGRLVVLLPLAPLEPGATYSLSLAKDAELFDLTGQVFSTTSVLGQFTVASSEPTDVAVVATWPPEGATGQSTIGEVTVVFDRPLLVTTVTDASFDVRVDGVAPTFDPDPAPLDVLFGLFPGQDTRVFRWTSLDGDGLRADLGTDATVTVDLSPTGDALTDLDGDAVPPTTLTFTTGALAPPSGGTLLPVPSDAIGIANLTAGDGDELTLEVDYPGALAGDRVTVWLFGTSTAEGGGTIAFEREVEVAADGVQTVVTLSQLDLVAQASPLRARFADGAVAVAFALSRSGAPTAVRNLDVDPADGIQDPLLDTMAPELLEVFFEDPEGGPLASDLRDLVLAGRASEELRAAAVTTSLGDNGAEAPVLGARADGAFLAAPVPLGVLGPSRGPVAYELTIYDRAMNPAAAAHTGSFEQRGALGPVALTPGAALDVEVYDAVTLQPIAGARTFTHRNDGAAYPLVGFQTTGAAGKAAPLSSATDTTILTVEADGYGLVSIVDVASTRVSIPLEPTDPVLGVLTGTLSSASDLAELTLAALDLRYGDPRRLTEGTPLFAGAACTTNPFGGGGLACPLGPQPLRAGRLGALSLLGGNFDLPQGSFSAASVLQAFELALPLAPLGAGTPAQLVELQAGLLGEPGAPVAGLPVELAQVVLDAAGLAGVDTGLLSEDAEVAGDAWVTASTLVPGLPGALPVGIGLSYDQGADRRDLRTAVPGAVLSGGTLDGVVDTDLYLEAGLLDQLGARSFRRSRVSALGALPTANELDLEDAPAITAPAALSSTGQVDYEVTVTNPLPDALGLPGVYRLTVIGESGRTWRLWLQDPGDGATVTLPLVDLVGAGGTGLASGSHTARVEAWAGPGFDLGDLLWSDLEREWEVLSSSAPVVYSVP